MTVKSEPGSNAASDHAEGNCGAAHYPHSRVDSGDLLKPPGAATKAGRPAATPGRPAPKTGHPPPANHCDDNEPFRTSGISDD